MAKQSNASCSICGERYYVCNTCKSMKTLKPWRTITDTVDCYKVYMIIHAYKHGTLTRENARLKLENCVLPKTFLPHIQTAIHEIMSPEKDDSLSRDKLMDDSSLFDNNQRK